MKKTATVIVFEEDPYNSMFNVLFADILNLPDVYPLIEKSLPVKYFYKFLPSRKLHALTFGLSHKLYLRYYELPRKVKELSRNYERINILFHNAGLRRPEYPMVVFDYLKKFPVTLNLLYLDLHEHEYVCRHANFLCEKKVFDRVMTFDPGDAHKYNMELCFTPYSKIPLVETCSSTLLYYCGTNGGRIYGLHNIWRMAKKNNVNIKYDLVWCKDFEHFFENDPNIYFHDSIVAYPILLNEMQQSECVLDFTQSGQSGFTLRPYEAVVYNKKLLTNNKRIFEFPFYNERYMKYFENAEDIDWNWLKTPIDVDYGYNEEFSPKALLQKINENR